MTRSLAKLSSFYGRYLHFYPFFQVNTMPCNHKRVWTVMRYVVSEDNWQGAVNAFGAKVLQPRYDTYIHKLLENGWDPYPWGEGGIMFKRLKPCEECPKAKITAGRFPSEIFDEYKKKHGI